MSWNRTPSSYTGWYDGVCITLELGLVLWKRSDTNVRRWDRNEQLLARGELFFEVLRSLKKPKKPSPVLASDKGHI